MPADDQTILIPFRSLRQNQLGSEGALALAPALAANAELTTVWTPAHEPMP